MGKKTGSWFPMPAMSEVMIPFGSAKKKVWWL